MDLDRLLDELKKDIKDSRKLPPEHKAALLSQVKSLSLSIKAFSLEGYF